MNTTMRAMLIASLALAFTACKKEEAAPVDEAKQRIGSGVAVMVAVNDGRASVAVGEIDQARGQLDETLPLGEAFEALVPEMTQGEVRTLLAKFGLKADHVNRPVDELSPGERTRASLALLQARGVNVLVLDEPTNHLDLEAIEQLEQALETYEGALLLVTHDRRMLDTVRTDRRWQVQDGRVTER